MHTNTTEAQELALFKQLAIRPSSVRVVVYRTIANFENTFSAQDVEDALSWMDKSSIFRTLTLFKDRGLIHPVDNGSGVKRYCLCSDFGQCDSKMMHCHFHCEVCGNTLCLNDVYLPNIELPSGFVSQKINCMIAGVCEHCSSM